MNTIAKNDALTFLKTCPEYDYVVLSPSDFGQLVYQGNIVQPGDIGVLYYKAFLDELVDLVNPKSGYASCIVTDRKHNGTIISRSSMFINAFTNKGWKIHTHKIWAHSLKTNLYRLTYSNVITFCKKKAPNYPTSEFRPDVWLMETPKDHKDKEVSHHGILPEKLLTHLIVAYSKKGDVVLDPFCGSGTTLSVAKQLGRNYLGCEIDDMMYNLAIERVKDII
jgi:DNA modification methylase